MPNSSPKNIVYLLGAGATHAELLNLFEDKFADATFEEKNGLLARHVSKRVFRLAKKTRVPEKKIAKLLSGGDLTNIELFIGLIGSNRIKSEKTTEMLNKLVREDISGRLSKTRLKKFYLHKALIELHEHSSIATQENLSGLVTLNYDNVLDDAYTLVHKEKPNYSLFSDTSKDTDSIPLLKLHGGFDLKDGKEKVPILAPGINKNYLELPYNFIWGRALRVLIKCDVLRVIGCSLSQNDMGLIDLLFKAHLARQAPFEIQIINRDPENNTIKTDYGFFPGLTTLREMEGRLFEVDDVVHPKPLTNFFKVWLKIKAGKMLTPAEIGSTSYLKRL